MQKTILLFVFSLLLFACSNSSRKENLDTKADPEFTIQEDNSEPGKKNYAVIWNWTTTDVKLVEENLPAISEELTELWKKGVVGNVYYDTGTPEKRLGVFPNITFFIKAPSESGAESILNKLTVVEKEIAMYKIHPVGVLWLDRKTDVINAKGITKTFVSVWTTNDSRTPSDELVVEQNDRMIKLWNEGMVENVYFDVEGVLQENERTDFVFFINTNSEAEAKELCNSLPFTREGITNYNLYPSGTFWMRQLEGK